MAVGVHRIQPYRFQVFALGAQPIPLVVGLDGGQCQVWLPERCIALDGAMSGVGRSKGVDGRPDQAAGDHRCVGFRQAAPGSGVGRILADGLLEASYGLLERSWRSKLEEMAPLAYQNGFHFGWRRALELSPG